MSERDDLVYIRDILDSIEISTKTNYNIKHLCTLIYDIAGQLLAPGGKDQALFQQRIPSKYIQLEDFLEDYRINKKNSILNEKEYSFLFSAKIK